ncbi:MAG: aromatic ring-hydroxylating dioxygenase subunit alpha [Alphaproteobacteria bacterium]|nr:MAG: aromatic ring-hydroxylating dioxygenase subunit alpha [Alphaproteobacteria bacterium]
MNRGVNRHTQAFRDMRVFNNWNVVARGWYIACKGGDLPPASVKSIEICGQRIAVFRDQKGKTHALDGFCPHMGADLGLGKVKGDRLQCFFHQWSFDPAGNCVDIPCLATPSPLHGKARLQAYATEEKYGFVWIYPAGKAPFGVADIPDLEGKKLVFRHGKAFERRCHHHINMINGIDAQHLRTVHQINIDMNVDIELRDQNTALDITMRGEFPGKTRRERLGRFLLGRRYEYKMRYADGCIGALSIMRGVYLFGGKRKLPHLNMIYAYQPVKGGARVQPIYVAEKRSGIWGGIKSYFLMWMMQIAYFALRDEDGFVYDNIRFNPEALLPIDRPVARYMAYVNALEPSIWSADWKKEQTERVSPLQSNSAA